MGEPGSCPRPGQKGGPKIYKNGKKNVVVQLLLSLSLAKGSPILKVDPGLPAV